MRLNQLSLSTELFLRNLLFSFFNTHMNTCNNLFYKDHRRLSKKIDWLITKRDHDKFSNIKPIKFSVSLNYNNISLTKNRRSPRLNVTNNNNIIRPNIQYVTDSSLQASPRSELHIVSIDPHAISV